MCVVLRKRVAGVAGSFEFRKNACPRKLALSDRAVSIRRRRSWTQTDHATTLATERVRCHLMSDN
jgi:hypothetical protein